MPLSPIPNDNDITPLPRPDGLYIQSSTPKGRGIFTSKLIPSGTTIEISSTLILSPRENTTHIEHTVLYHYTYNWPLLNPSTGEPTGRTTQAVVFGLGSMFNHSTREQNVGWTRDLERNFIVYRALRDIQPGEELCISYGDRLTFEDADGSAVNGDERLESEEEHLGRIQLGT